MMQETANILQRNLEFLPLKSYVNIVEGNALRLNWEDVVPKEKLNYIIGNPPFVGARLMNEGQKKDMQFIFKGIKNSGNLDYVGCWYKKAYDLMKNTDIQAALVSTNSITQGEQPGILWKPLMKDGLIINFAWRTFNWSSEANEKARVHCVIIGFSCTNSKTKIIYLNESQKVYVNNINAYLVDAPNVIVESRNKPLCDVPEIGIGNKPIDGGYYLFSEEEKSEFLKKEPNAEKYFRPWIGADELIKGYFRYCLWLGNCSPSEIKTMPECLKRVEAVKQFRLKSKSEGTRKIAEKPTRFHVENMPDREYIVLPEVTTANRRYIPIGFMNPEVLSSNLVKIMPNATKYHFGVLTSNVHMAWMRAVCGRMRIHYRYSKDIVYNNFPWCEPTSEQKKKIEETAQRILDVRLKYSDCSLADLYDDTLMPPDLREAHRANDRAVMQAYGFNIKMTESECVAELFKLYQQKVK